MNLLTWKPYRVFRRIVTLALCLCLMGTVALGYGGAAQAASNQSSAKMERVKSSERMSPNERLIQRSQQMLQQAASDNRSPNSATYGSSRQNYGTRRYTDLNERAPDTLKREGDTGNVVDAIRGRK